MIYELIHILIMEENSTAIIYCYAITIWKWENSHGNLAVWNLYEVYIIIKYPEIAQVCAEIYFQVFDDFHELHTRIVL